MKNLIYQYWQGSDLQSQVKCSLDNIEQYARRIGCEYKFELNPNFSNNLGRYTPHYNQFKVVYDKEFDQYDNVLFLDCDIFAVDGLTKSIFKEFDTTKDLGICREEWQTYNRSAAFTAEDDRWAKKMERLYGVKIPRTSDNRVLVYNSGVVMYSHQGRKKMRDRFVNFQEYQKQVSEFRPLFSSDQGYIHAMMGRLDWQELSEDWNRYIHYLPNTRGPKRPVNDTRVSTTNFVHIQLTGSSSFTPEQNYNIVNKPTTEWSI